MSFNDDECFCVCQKGNTLCRFVVYYTLLFRKVELASGYKSNQNDSMTIQSFFYRVWSGLLLRSAYLLMRFTRSSVAMSKQHTSTADEYMDSWMPLNLWMFYCYYYIYYDCYYLLWWFSFYSDFSKKDMRHGSIKKLA